MHPYIHRSTIHNSQDMQETLNVHWDELTGEWIKKVQYTHNGVLLGHEQNDTVPSAATWT